MFDMNLNIYLVCQNCYLSIEKIHKILGFQINHTLVFSQFISSAQFLALIYIPRPIYYSIGRLIVVLSAKKATIYQIQMLLHREIQMLFYRESHN